jgi:hypothetical protein
MRAILSLAGPDIPGNHRLSLVVTSVSGNARAEPLGSNTIYFMLGRSWAGLASAALDSRSYSKRAALV